MKTRIVPDERVCWGELDVVIVQHMFGEHRVLSVLANLWPVPSIFFFAELLALRFCEAFRVLSSFVLFPACPRLLGTTHIVCVLAPGCAGWALAKRHILQALPVCALPTLRPLHLPVAFS